MEDVKKLQDVAKQLEKTAKEINALPDEEKSVRIQELLDQSGLTLENIEQLQKAINNGADVDATLQNALDIALPIFLTQQEDHTTVPTGYHMLDAIVPVKTVENGAIVFDYQDYTQGDGKNAYFGAMVGKGDWTELTKTKGELVGIEGYKVSMNYHKTALTYTPLFTKAHKNTTLFVLQFNDLLKKVSQPLMDFMLAVRAKVLAVGLSAEQDIVLSDEDINIKPSTYVSDFNLEAEDGYKLIAKLNNLIQNLKLPSRNSLKGKSAEDFKIKGLATQLKRSLGSDYKIVVSYEFIEALDKGVRAGSFNEEFANVINEVRSAFYPISFDVFGSEYGNITGIVNNISGNQDGMSGSTDIILITPNTLQVINQYDASNTFGLPNNTTAFNSWVDLGVAVSKYENQMVQRIRLVISEAK